MLDLKFVKENKEAVAENIRNRNMQVDLDRILELYDQRSSLIQEAEELRKKRNENAKKMKGKLSPEDRQILIEEGKTLKNDIASVESRLEKVENELFAQAGKIPNMAHPDAPVGKEEKDNLEIKRFLEPTVFNFTPKDHVQLGQELDLIDFETATRVTGPKF